MKTVPSRQDRESVEDQLAAAQTGATIGEQPPEQGLTPEQIAAAAGVVAAAGAAGGAGTTVAGATTAAGATTVATVPASAVLTAEAGAVVGAAAAALRALRPGGASGDEIFWLFMALKSEADQGAFGVGTVSDGDLLAASEREREYERMFWKRVGQRLTRDLPGALRTDDPRGAVQKILDRERRWVIAHHEAALGRARADLKRRIVEVASPQGAYWVLRAGLKHCPTCLTMASVGWWPWEVLKIVHPPVHPNCGCDLLTHSEAQTRGLMGPEIPDTEVMLKRARAMGLMESNAGLCHHAGHSPSCPGHDEDGPVLELEEADHSDGIMVALYPDPELAVELALDKGEEPKQLHLTLAYLGKVSEHGTDPSAVLDAVRKWAENCPPLQGEISGFGKFVGGDSPVTYASVDLPALPEQRQALVDALGRTPSPAKQDHGYTPHITLDYASRQPKIEKPIPVSFKEVHVVWGLEDYSLPLGDPANPGSLEEARWDRRFSKGTIWGGRFMPQRGGFAPRVSLKDILRSVFGANAPDVAQRGEARRTVGQRSPTALPAGTPTGTPETRKPLPAKSAMELAERVRGRATQIAKDRGVGLKLGKIEFDPLGDDSAGKRQWNGDVTFGPDPALVIEQAAESEGIVPDSTAALLYHGYRVINHEMLHGINPQDPSEYFGAQRAMEEALVEELAHVNARRDLREAGYWDVLRWLERNPDDLRARGMYQPQRAGLRAVLDAAKVPLAERESLIETLKFSVPSAQREMMLGGLVARAQGTTPEEGRLFVSQTMTDVDRAGATMNLGVSILSEKPLAGSQMELHVGATVKVGDRYEGVITNAGWVANDQWSVEVEVKKPDGTLTYRYPSPEEVEVLKDIPAAQLTGQHVTGEVKEGDSVHVVDVSGASLTGTLLAVTPGQNGYWTAELETGDDRYVLSAASVLDVSRRERITPTERPEPPESPKAAFRKATIERAAKMLHARDKGTATPFPDEPEDRKERYRAEAADAIDAIGEMQTDVQTLDVDVLAQEVQRRRKDDERDFADLSDTEQEDRREQVVTGIRALGLSVPTPMPEVEALDNPNDGEAFDARRYQNPTRPLIHKLSALKVGQTLVMADGTKIARGHKGSAVQILRPDGSSRWYNAPHRLVNAEIQGIADRHGVPERVKGNRPDDKVAEATAEPKLAGAKERKRIASMKEDDYIALTAPIPPNFDPEIPEHHEAFERSLKARREWMGAVSASISLGELDPTFARQELGYYGVPADNWKPLPKQTFHVTTASGPIMESGLKTRRELSLSGGKGLGSGPSEWVSLTDMLDVAEGIAAGMIEAGRIARGEITVHEMIVAAEDGDGADRPWLERTVRQFGFPKWKIGDPYPPEVQRMLDDEDAVQAGTLQPTESMVEDRLRFARNWRFFRHAENGPMDPYITGVSAEALAQITPENTKIVEVERANRKVRGTFHAGLSEWRVPTGEAVKPVRVLDPTGKVVRGNEIDAAMGEHWEQMLAGQNSPDTLAGLRDVYERAGQNSPSVHTSARHIAEVEARHKLVDAYPRGAQMADAVAQATEDAMLVTRVDEATLLQMLEAPDEFRLAPQFDHGIPAQWRFFLHDHDQEDPYIVERRKMEAVLYGEGVHPFYGYLMKRQSEAEAERLLEPQDPGDRRADMYGNVRIEFKDSVKDRATYTVGDSLNNAEYVVPTPIGQANPLAIAPTPRNRFDFLEGSNIAALNELRGEEYVEAQIFGKRPGIEDIERVVLEWDADGFPATALLDELGIPWVQLDEDGQRAFHGSPGQFDVDEYERVIKEEEEEFPDWDWMNKGVHPQVLADAQASPPLKPLPPTGEPVLDAAGGHFVSGPIRDLLIRKGRAYHRDDTKIEGKYPDLTGTPKECYRNASLAVQQYPDLTYVEGFAIAPKVPFPVMHAWAVDPDGNVVDPTWPDGQDYYGIPISTEDLTAVLLHTKRYGVLNEIWTDPWIAERLDFDRRGGQASPSDSGFTAWTDVEARYGELVPTEALLPYLEFDRDVVDDEDSLDLTDSMAREGVRDAVVLDYNPESGRMYLADGNHRVKIANLLGIKTIPVVGGVTEKPPSEAGVGGGEPPEGVTLPESAPMFVRPSDLGLPVLGRFAPGDGKERSALAPAPVGQHSPAFTEAEEREANNRRILQDALLDLPAAQESPAVTEQEYDSRLHRLLNGWVADPSLALRDADETDMAILKEEVEQGFPGPGPYFRGQGVTDPEPIESDRPRGWSRNLQRAVKSASTYVVSPDGEVRNDVVKQTMLDPGERQVLVLYVANGGNGLDVTERIEELGGKNPFDYEQEVILDSDPNTLDGYQKIEVEINNGGTAFGRGPRSVGQIMQAVSDGLTEAGVTVPDAGEYGERVLAAQASPALYGGQRSVRGVSQVIEPERLPEKRERQRRQDRMLDSLGQASPATAPPEGSLRWAVSEWSGRASYHGLKNEDGERLKWEVANRPIAPGTYFRGQQALDPDPEAGRPRGFSKSLIQAIGYGLDLLDGNEDSDLWQVTLYIAENPATGVDVNEVLGGGMYQHEQEVILDHGWRKIEIKQIPPELVINPEHDRSKLVELVRDRLREYGIKNLPDETYSRGMAGQLSPGWDGMKTLDSAPGPEGWDGYFWDMTREQFEAQAPLWHGSPIGRMGKGPIHVGSKQAARDAVRGKVQGQAPRDDGWDIGDPLPEEGFPSGPDGEMYRVQDRYGEGITPGLIPVTISPEATLFPVTQYDIWRGLDDENPRPEEWGWEEPLRWATSDTVIPYENGMEDSGSISYVAPSSNGFWTHRDWVKAAILEGKTMRDEVLDEYPDLKALYRERQTVQASPALPEVDRSPHTEGDLTFTHDEVSLKATPATALLVASGPDGVQRGSIYYAEWPSPRFHSRQPTATILYATVGKKYRRQGVMTALVKDLRRRHPREDGWELDTTELSPDGQTIFPDMPEIDFVLDGPDGEGYMRTGDRRGQRSPSLDEMFDPSAGQASPTTAEGISQDPPEVLPDYIVERGGTLFVELGPSDYMTVDGWNEDGEPVAYTGAPITPEAVFARSEEYEKEERRRDAEEAKPYDYPGPEKHREKLKMELMDWLLFYKKPVRNSAIRWEIDNGDPGSGPFFRGQRVRLGVRKGTPRSWSRDPAVAVYHFMDESRNMPLAGQPWTIEFLMVKDPGHGFDLEAKKGFGMNYEWEREVMLDSANFPEGTEVVPVRIELDDPSMTNPEVYRAVDKVLREEYGYTGDRLEDPLERANAELADRDNALIDMARGQFSPADTDARMEELKAIMRDENVSPVERRAAFREKNRLEANRRIMQRAREAADAAMRGDDKPGFTYSLTPDEMGDYLATGEYAGESGYEYAQRDPQLARDEMLGGRWGDPRTPGFQPTTHLLSRFRDDKPIWIYRAVDPELEGVGIVPGAYVSESRSYAKAHGRSNMQRYRTVKMRVLPSDLVWEGAPHEFLYAPGVGRPEGQDSPSLPEQEPEILDAQARGYTPLPGGEWFGAGGCAHLALAFKNLYPNMKIAAGWYDDHGRRALGHAAAYDPDAGIAFDNVGTHEYPEIVVSDYADLGIEMDQDPAELAEHMGIDWSPEGIWNDDGVYEGAQFIERHFSEVLPKGQASPPDAPVLPVRGQMLKDAGFPEVFSYHLNGQHLLKAFGPNEDVFIIEDPDDPDFDPESDPIPFDRWIYDVDPTDFIEAPDYTADFWGFPSILFHGTTAENAEAIMREGLKPGNKTRGITNRGYGAAIFATEDWGVADIHYSAGGTGAVLRIDTSAMKEDGFTPAIEPEYPIQEAEQRGALAAALDEFEFEVEYPYDGVAPDTRVMFEPIPPKYLSVVDGQASPGLDNASRAYIAEGALKRGGLTGRDHYVPVGKMPDPDGDGEVALGTYGPIPQELSQWASEVAGFPVKVVASTWWPEAEYGPGKTFAAADHATQTIHVTPETDDLTLLHEIAHLMVGPEVGHDDDWIDVVADLYGQHISPEAKRSFLSLVRPGQDSPAARPTTVKMPGTVQRHDGTEYEIDLDYAPADGTEVATPEYRDAYGEHVARVRRALTAWGEQGTYLADDHGTTGFHERIRKILEGDEKPQTPEEAALAWELLFNSRRNRNTLYRGQRVRSDDPDGDYGSAAYEVPRDIRSWTNDSYTAGEFADGLGFDSDLFNEDDESDWESDVVKVDPGEAFGIPVNAYFRPFYASGPVAEREGFMFSKDGEWILWPPVQRLAGSNKTFSGAAPTVSNRGEKPMVIGQDSPALGPGATESFGLRSVEPPPVPRVLYGALDPDLGTAAQDWSDALTIKERQVVAKYLYGDYPSIDADGWATLNSAARSGVLPRPMVLHRGVTRAFGGNELWDLQPGDEWSSDGRVLSTSADPDTALTTHGLLGAYGGGDVLLLDLNVPPGQRAGFPSAEAGWLFNDEYEVLLPSGTKMVVTDVTDTPRTDPLPTGDPTPGTIRRVTARVLPGGQASPAAEGAVFPKPITLEDADDNRIRREYEQFGEATGQSSPAITTHAEHVAQVRNLHKRQKARGEKMHPLDLFYSNNRGIVDKGEADYIARLVEQARLTVRMEPETLDLLLGGRTLTGGVKARKRAKWRREVWADTDPINRHGHKSDPYLKERREAEQRLFGDHPVYGYFTNGFDFGHYAMLGTQQYGGVAVILKDDVKDRTSYTIGDSLDESDRVVPAPVGKSSVLATTILGSYAKDARTFPTLDGFLTSTGFDGRDGDIHNVRPRYAEAQIFGGGVSLDDVEMVLFTANGDNGWGIFKKGEPVPGPTEKQRKALDDAGVPWAVVGPDDQLIESGKVPVTEFWKHRKVKWRGNNPTGYPKDTPRLVNPPEPPEGYDPDREREEVRPSRRDYDRVKAGGISPYSKRSDEKPKPGMFLNAQRWPGKPTGKFVDARIVEVTDEGIVAERLDNGDRWTFPGYADLFYYKPGGYEEIQAIRAEYGQGSPAIPPRPVEPDPIMARFIGPGSGQASPSLDADAAGSPEVQDAIADLEADYPDVAVRVQRYVGEPGTYAYVMGRGVKWPANEGREVDFDGRTINLTKLFFDDDMIDALREESDLDEEGYGAPLFAAYGGSREAIRKALVTHEFGHVLFNWLGVHGLDRHQEIYKAAHFGMHSPEVTPPSRYAMTNRQEFIAEAFADYRMNGEDAVPVSKYIGRVIDEGPTNVDTFSPEWRALFGLPPKRPGVEAERKMATQKALRFGEAPRGQASPALPTGPQLRGPEPHPLLAQIIGPGSGQWSPSLASTVESNPAVKETFDALDEAFPGILHKVKDDSDRSIWGSTENVGQELPFGFVRSPDIGTVIFNREIVPDEVMRYGSQIVVTEKFFDDEEVSGLKRLSAEHESTGAIVDGIVGTPGWIGKYDTPDDARRSIVIHEFGHVLTNALAEHHPDAAEALMDFVHEPFKVPLAKGDSFLVTVPRYMVPDEAPSHYARQNAHEFIAESFADYWTNGEDAKEASKVIGGAFFKANLGSPHEQALDEMVGQASPGYTPGPDHEKAVTKAASQWISQPDKALGGKYADAFMHEVRNGPPQHGLLYRTQEYTEPEPGEDPERPRSWTRSLLTAVQRATASIVGPNGEVLQRYSTPGADLLPGHRQVLTIYVADGATHGLDVTSTVERSGIPNPYAFEREVVATSGNLKNVRRIEVEVGGENGRDVFKSEQAARRIIGPDSALDRAVKAQQSPGTPGFNIFFGKEPPAPGPATDQAKARSEAEMPSAPVKGIPRYKVDLTFDKPAGGSNGAKFMKDPDGNGWIIKHYSGDEERVATELLANAVYRELGVPAPNAGILMDGGEFDFSAIPDVDVGEPPLPTGSKNKSHGLQWQKPRISTGIIIVEPDGKVWIYEPLNHFGGYEHTFSKGGLEKGLTPQQNAHKELWEEMGLQAEIVGYLGDYEGDTSTSRFYLARRTAAPLPPDGKETEAVKLVTPQEAANLLNRSRDLHILADVVDRIEEGWPGEQPPILNTEPPRTPVKPAIGMPLVDAEERHWDHESEALGAGFVADALLANWDVVGLSQDNILWTDDDVPIRVDQGGTFEMRAQGSPKEYGPVPVELWTMNRPGGQAFGAMKVTEDDMRAQARDIELRLTPERIDELVDEAPFEDNEMRERIRENLKARVEWLGLYGAGEMDLPEPAEGKEAIQMLRERDASLVLTDDEAAGVATLLTSNRIDDWIAAHKGKKPSYPKPKAKQVGEVNGKPIMVSPPPPDPVEKVVKSLRSLMASKATLTTEDVAGYMVVPDLESLGVAVPSQLEGRWFRDPSFVRLDAEAPEPGTIRMRVLIPAGSNLLIPTAELLGVDTLGKSEGTMLLPEGTRVKVVGVTADGEGGLLLDAVSA